MIPVNYRYCGSSETSHALRLWIPKALKFTWDGTEFYVAQRKKDKKLYIYNRPMWNSDPFAGPFGSLRLALVALELLS